MGLKVDLSEFQGNVNFPELAKLVDFATLRVQAGSSHPDTKYKEYAAGCKANKLPFGTYAFGRFLDPADAEKEASDGVSRMDPASHYFVVDVETECTLVKTELVAATQAYVNKLRALGVKKIGLYSGESFYKEHGLDKVTGIDFLWLAKYPDGDNGTLHLSGKPETPCHLWQYSEKGKLAAIPDNFVDLSEIVGSKDIYFFGVPQPVAKVEAVSTSVHSPKPVPVAKPAPTSKPAPKPATKPAAPTYTDYVVKSGDTFWGIAQAHQVDVNKLIAANAQYEKMLPAGVTIKIPK